MNRELKKVMQRHFSQIQKFAPGGTALGARQIFVRASDSTPDHDGDVMVAAGCDHKSYDRNPIVLADHDPTKPIGKASIDIRADGVYALIEFAPAGASAKADEYCALAKSGILGAVSIGFRPIESKPTAGGAYRFEKWELLEISLVSVPANSNALIVQRGLSAKSSPTLPPEFFKTVDVSRQVECVIADDNDYESGQRIITEGCDVEPYKKNRRVLWAHDENRVVAYCSGIKWVGGQLIATAQFPAEGRSYLADSCFDAIKRGELRATSVGIRIVNKTKLADGNEVLTHTVLGEWSFVKWGADPYARVLRIGGKSVSWNAGGTVAGYKTPLPKDFASPADYMHALHFAGPRQLSARYNGN